MRNALVVMFAAFAGLHCGSSVDDGAADEAPIAADPAPSGSATERTPTPRPSADTSATNDVEEADPSFGVSVRAPDGSVFEVGTFRRPYATDESVLRTSGGRDVFLTKRAADGTESWTRQMGGPGEETSPRASLSEDGERVTVVGGSNGPMGCGPTHTTNTWSSSTFFVCSFDQATGELVEGGVFPIGSP